MASCQDLSLLMDSIVKYLFDVRFEPILSKKKES